MTRLLSRRSRFAALLLALALLWPAAPARSAGIPGFIVVPYRVVANRYILRCTLNGKPLNMLIDSGAAVSLIDRYAFDQSIPKAEQITPKGVPPKIKLNGVQVPVMLTKNLQFGSMKFEDRPVAIGDMSQANIAARHYAADLQNERGIETVVVDGLIGLDILRTYNAVVDTGRHVMYLNPDKSKRGGMLGDHMTSYGFKRVRMIYSDGNVEVPSTLQGKPGRLLVDTGAFLTVLDYKYARSAGVSIKPTLMKMGLGLGGQGDTAVFLATPDEFKIGDFTYPKGSIACQGLEYQMMGLLGPELLEKAHAIIDFGNLSMFLK